MLSDIEFWKTVPYSPQEKKGKVEGSSPTLVYFPGNFCDDASTYPIKSQGSAVTVTFLSRAEVAMKGSLLTYATQETVSGKSIMILGWG